MRRRLRDVVFVIPGITGSVLQRDGRTIWAPSHRFAARSLLRPAEAAAALALGPDDAERVVATGLVPDTHMIAGLVKIDGYSDLVEAIGRNFEVEPARTPGGPTNLVEFAYDWRLDNRVNAHRLAQVVHDSLDRWRRHAHLPDARAVLIAHSMGGLIGRYFLEVLEGWRDARALVTFGTPFRGSPNALGYLANGYKKLNIDLTDAMRGFPSTYQLMPVYEAVRTDGGYARAAEIGSIPGVDEKMAQDALAFHREIETAVAANDAIAPRRYGLITVAGTRQPTYQSAVLGPDRSLSLSRTRPPQVEMYFEDEGIEGDGTVPLVSASPVDTWADYHDSFTPETHSSLQRDPQVLYELLGRLAKMQMTGLGKVRDPAVASTATSRPGISLDLDDAFGGAEPVQFSARPTGVVTETVEALVEGGTDTWEVPLNRDGDSWTCDPLTLDPGTYRVTVTARGTDTAPVSVHDVFQIHR